MRTWAVYIVLVFIIVACSNTKNSIRQNGDSKIVVIAAVHTPYCGGAAPTPEQERGHVSPLSNESFVIKRGSVNLEGEPVILRVVSNDEGRIEFNLPAGEYVLLNNSKGDSFKRFYEQFKKLEGNSVQYGDEKCYREWYEKPELQFTVVEKNHEFAFTRNTRCFVGANPCMRYTGPLPP